MTRRTTPTAIAVLLALAIPASGGAAVPRTADVAVHLEGVQRTTWEAHHAAIGDCDVSYDGSGSETYRFRSRTIVLRAIELPRGGVLFTRGGRPAVLPLTGSVTRTGSFLRGTGKVCSAGDGTGTQDPAPPDCGSRSVRNAVEVNFGVRVRDRLEISDGDPQPDPFANCPTGVSEQYPTIMAWGDADRRIGRRLPSGDLFAYGRNILIARGTRTRTSSELTSLTTVRWTATLTRVRPGGRRPPAPALS